ncbi:outer membrane protein [Martelella endophytica]|uniref:Lipid A oxidase n=1 Tax=Martelella endophytica TaxID=1486262 RepID=A0A0D5LPU4_MAREN|nr:outer membrane beta-barrel protein [Martelella endophytica]AJY46151.1 lipid A oxidase [Martelella endophytica]
MRLSYALPIVALFAGIPATASAEMALSLYSGYQSAPHSDVDVNGTKVVHAGWEGKSFEAPPYFGVRGTWWLDQFGMPDLGIALDYAHNKVYSDDDTRAQTGWSHFEFTDGLNILTLNALYRFPLGESRWKPYVGVGAGINVPHVEVTRPSGRTYEYQFGGASLQAQAGVAYEIAKHWDLFVEYKANYSWIDVDIDSGDSLQTNILTNAINLGVSFKF